MARRTQKKKNSEISTDKLVLTMTVSLFIILLAFFILLNAIAITDEKKKRVLVGSLVQSFGGESDAEPLGEFSDEEFSEGVSPLDLSDLSSGKNQGLKDIRVSTSGKWTTLSIPEDLLFLPESARLTPGGEGVLSELVQIIEKNPYPMNISAHTDDMPIYERTGMTLLELSVLRSMSVLAYFIDKKQLAPEKMVAFGWGKERPEADNTTAESRKFNRRIDLTFVHDRPLEKPRGFFLFKDFFFKLKDKDQSHGR